MSKKSSLSKLILDFLDYLEIEKNRSPLTIRNYHHYLKELISFLDRKINPSPTLTDLTLENIRDFRKFLAEKKKDGRNKFLRKVTQGYYMIALRSFLRWLAKNDYQAISPEKIDLPKSESRVIKFLSAEETEKFLAQPSISKEMGLRDKAILELLFSTGLRVSELVALNRDQINLRSQELGVVGKGGRARVVFISQRAKKWLERYIVARNDRYKPLFIRYSGKRAGPSTSGELLRLTARSVQRMVEKYRRKAGLAVKVTPHVLRHSFATDLLTQGADLRSVQELLGHKNVATTQIYTHVTNKRLREIHKKFHSGNKAL